jgi:hypothetical protein
MKNKWSASDWVQIILAATIPLAVFAIIINRLFAGAPLSPEASSVINNLVTVIAGGLLVTISKNKEFKEEKAKEQKDEKLDT